jgi:c-di-GMP-binding flagellar brake protein YcgR
MGTNSDDKRQWKRYKVDLRVRIVFTKDGARQSAFARGFDVSEGGMAIFSAVELQSGDHVDVEFSLPRSRMPLLIKSVVRNREGYRFGLEFLTLSHSQRLDIVRLCETALLLHPAS